LDDFYYINSFPDSLDVVNLFIKGQNTTDFNHAEMKLFLRKNLHCSAFIKPLGNELYSAHTTWVFASMMNRIFKHISLPFSSNSLIVSNQVSFSSYPTQIASADDFYKTDTGLVVIETTNNIFNRTLYQALSHRSLLSWTRSTLANRAARNGNDWARLFAIFNSGTYNCQWMVVDYKRFNHSTGLLTILEQIPGKVQSGDETNVLTKQGYWSSYNIPFFKDIYDISGYGPMEKKFGPNEFSHDQCWRARIFRRANPLVKGPMDVKNLMRYNNFRVDPICNGANDPDCAISARDDLDPKNPFPNGGIDSKMVSRKLFEEQAVDIVGGPTHLTLKPFRWDENNSYFENWPHLGQPNLFAFDWIKTLDTPKKN